MTVRTNDMQFYSVMLRIGVLHLYILIGFEYTEEKMHFVYAFITEWFS